MEMFLTYIRIARKNKGMLYYYEGMGYVYSPCRDLYGEPVVNFREGKEYGKELTKQDCEEIKKVKQLKTQKK